MDNLQAERIESLKAGILAAFCLLVADGMATLFHQVVLVKQLDLLASLALTTSFSLLASLAIACISGFVFGITYRYAIRSDDNSHLGDGAVLAFGLVRGLAQLQAGLNYPALLWSSAVLALESLVLFAIARYILDWAIANTWLKPLK
ncbi:hypothetical protein [Microseira wollei]|uniref:Uncharacterized protein n=1 Tax=Microseira wollei NIES-4236 TaxID=2530354 RepID=A0AAV3XKM3_9CYAN|nr:hypothetical protein [Microseira wollei]GET43024.1 hypothetical protein MiSe_78440 [Microseira wollei NIES-4236]